MLIWSYAIMIDLLVLFPSYIISPLQWASCQIHVRKIAGCACAGNAGKVFPRHRLQRKPLVSDPGMHHGTCVKHVPWCMSGSLTRGGGENVPGIPGACATCNFTYLVRGPWHRQMISLLAGATWTYVFYIVNNMLSKQSDWLSSPGIFHPHHPGLILLLWINFNPSMDK